MKHVNIGQVYNTQYMNIDVKVEVLKIIPNSESYQCRWDMVSIVKAVDSGMELLRRFSELKELDQAK